MIQLTGEKIDTEQVLEHVCDPECGAEVLFVGTTRRWTQHPDGRRLETEHLIYEAYEEMAVKQLERLETEARQRWPVQRIAIVHRLGKVLPTEASVAIAVSCPHRSESFEAAKWLIDTIKHEVPIWKQEHYVQSGAEWIHPTSGSCRCDSTPAQPPVDPAQPPVAAAQLAQSTQRQP